MSRIFKILEPESRPGCFNPHHNGSWFLSDSMIHISGFAAEVGVQIVGREACVYWGMKPPA